MENAESKPIEKTLSERLIEARALFGVPSMSLKSDVSMSQVQLMITGKQPLPRTKEKIEKYLKKNNL